ncbi:MAG: phage tail tape measure protein, partial [Oscillospiraceae bacterium]|nr:phage tail tape measure protein [Oscillospiraceae bacterium]
MSQLGKIHNIEFQLNAQTGSSFSSSFTKAQQEFAKLGKEIQSLNKVQSDISSYQKQQNAVQNTEAKLQNLQKQYDLIQREIAETEGPTAGLEREQAKLEQRISDTTAALERQNQKLTATGQRLEEAEVNTDDLTKESAELTARLEELRQRQESVADSAQDMSRSHQEAGEAAENFGSTAADAFSAAQQALASAGIAAGLHEIYEAYSECVSIAAGFEQSISAVEALSGATSGELQKLSAAAKEAGAETSFTALQSADAFQYMSLAGWNTNQMLAGLQPVLDLSAAANMDLATASDIVTDYLTAFGLTAQDTGEFVDQMAYAMANSNTNVIQLGEAYKKVAATAKSLGYTVEDTTAVIMTMADAGVKGGEAGTAMNAVMTRLATDTKGCASALAEYGVEIYDAQGNMQSLSSILNGISSIWSDLTDQQQANLAKIIAGTSQYSSFQTIMTGCGEAATKSGKSFNDYAAALQNCSGTAGRMASIMLDNLNGQLTLMDSAADALKTTIGEQFNPELRKLAEIGTDVLTGVNGFVEEHPALVKGVMAFTGVMGTAAVAVTGVNAALMAFKALNVAALFTGPVGAILGVSAAVAGVVAAVVGMNTVLEDGTPTVKELTEAAREMDTVLSDAAGTCDETAASVLAAANVADTYISKLEAMGDYAQLSADGQREYHNILALLSETVPELAGSIDLENNAIEGGTAALRANTEAWKQNAMAQAYQDRLSAVYAAQADVLIEAEKNSIELTRAQTALEAAEKKRADTLARMNELQEEMAEAGGNSEQVRALQYEYDQLSLSLGDVENEILLSEKAMEVYTQAIEDGQEAVDNAAAEIDLAEEAVRRLTGAVEE